MDIRDVASMNMDIGVLRGIAMTVKENDVFDMITCSLDGLEEIATKMLDEIEEEMRNA